MTSCVAAVLPFNSHELFAITVITSLVAVLAGGAGCGRSSSNCPGLTAPTGPTYTISGVITAYRGGPVSRATVWAYPVYASLSEGTCNGTPSTETDQQGHYSWSGPSSGTGQPRELLPRRHRSRVRTGCGWTAWTERQPVVRADGATNTVRTRGRIASHRFVKAVFPTSVASAAHRGFVRAS